MSRWRYRVGMGDGYGGRADGDRQVPDERADVNMTTATERRVIGGGRLSSGRFYVVATKGDRNTVYWMDPGRIHKTKWDGFDVVACCTVGECLVCLTSGEVVYVVEGDAVSTIAVPRAAAGLNAVAPLGAQRALAGGDKGVVLSINLEKRRARLLDLQARYARPERDILTVVAVPGGVLLLGRDELLVHLDLKREFVYAATAEAEAGVVQFTDGALANGRLWLLALVQGRPYLATYDQRTDAFAYYDAPGGGSAEGRAPVMQSQGTRLILASRVVYAGMPDHWMAVADLKEPVAAAIILSENASECDVVTTNGDVVPVKLP